MTRHRESGFTLVELLMSISILAIVGTVFIGAVFEDLQASGVSAVSLTDAAGSYVLSARLLDDVRSAVSVETAAELGTQASPCTVPSGTPLFWTTNGATPPVYAVYYQETTSGRSTLGRETCQSGGANLSQDTSNPLATWSGTVSVMVTCDGEPICGAAPQVAVVTVPQDNLRGEFELAVATRAS